MRARDPEADVTQAAEQRMEMMRGGILTTLARLEQELGA
jgi:hypothetical protein